MKVRVSVLAELPGSGDGCWTISFKVCDGDKTLGADCEFESCRSSGGRLLDLAGGCGGIADDDLSGNWCVCLGCGGSEGSSGGGGVSIIRGTGASFRGNELLLGSGPGGGG